MSIFNQAVLSNTNRFFRGKSVVLCENETTTGVKDYIPTEGYNSLVFEVAGSSGATFIIEIYGYYENGGHLDRISIVRAGMGLNIGYEVSDRGLYKINTEGLSFVRVNIKEINGTVNIKGNYSSAVVSSPKIESLDVLRNRTIAGNSSFTSGIRFLNNTQVDFVVKRSGTGNNLTIDILYFDRLGIQLMEDEKVIVLTGLETIETVDLKSPYFRIRANNNHVSSREVWVYTKHSSEAFNRPSEWIEHTPTASNNPLPWRYHFDKPLKAAGNLLALNNIDKIPIELTYKHVLPEGEFSWSDGEGFPIKSAVEKGKDKAVLGPIQLFPKFNGGIIEVGGKIWEFNEERLRAVAIDKDDNIYTGGNSQKLIKLSPDGDIIWERSTGSTISAIAVFGDAVYTNGDGTLIKFNLNGTELFELPFTTPINLITPFQSGLYFRSGDNVVKTNESGTVIFSEEMTSSPIGIAKGDGDDLFVAVGGVIKKMTDTGSGLTEVWSTDLESTVTAGVHYGLDGHIYTGTINDLVQKLNPSGTVVDTLSLSWRPLQIISDNNNDLYIAGVGSAGRSLKKYNNDLESIWRAVLASDNSEGLAIDSYYNVIQIDQDGNLFKVANVPNNLQMRFQIVK